MFSACRFWSGVAQNAINFALVLLVVNETDLTILSSLLVLALVVPSTVAGIAAGAASDAFPKRPIVFLAELTRAGLCVLFVWAQGGVLSYFFVAAALATAGQFAGSARGAILPAIVARDQLAKANAIGHAIGGASQIIGLGVLTPVALRVLDNPDVLFLACGGMFVISAVQGVLIGHVRRAPRQEVGGRDIGPWYAAGWRYLKHDPRAMHAAVELTLISTALIILAGLIPRFINDVIGLPVEIGAVVLLPAAIGVALGLRLAGALAHRVPHALMSTTGFVSFVALLFLVTFARTEAEFLGGYGAFSFLNHISIGRFDGGGALTMVLMLPLGFSYAIVAVAAQTVLNDVVPLHLQGRVLAAQGAMAALASSLPVVAAGALTDLVGVTPVMALLAGLIGCGALASIREPRRKAPAGLTPAPERPPWSH